MIEWGGQQHTYNDAPVGRDIAPGESECLALTRCAIEADKETATGAGNLITSARDLLLSHGRDELSQMACNRNVLLRRFL